MCRLLTPYARRTAIRRAVSLVNHPGKVIVPAKPLVGKHGTVACQEALRPFTGPPGPGMLTRDPAAFDALKRAQVRAMAQLIACDIHPLNNVGPLRYLKNGLGQDQARIDTWYHHWILEGFAALETMVAATPYAAGAELTLADICVVPQVANARRLKVPLDRFPKIVAVDAACGKLDAFIKARPDNQPDAE